MAKIFFQRYYIRQETERKIIMRIYADYNTKSAYKANFTGKTNLIKRITPKAMTDYFAIPEKTSELCAAVRYYNTGSNEELKNLFSLTHNKRELLFAKNMLKSVLGKSEEGTKTVIDLLSSKHKDKFVNDADSFYSYFVMNKNSKTMVKDLEELIDSGKYNPKTYDMELYFRRIKSKQMFHLDENTEKGMRENFSFSRLNFLDSLQCNFLVYRREASKQCQNEILEMFKSANSQNIGIRKDLIHRYKFSDISSISDKSVDKDVNNIKGLQKLFDKIDNEPEVGKLVDKMLEKDLIVKNPDMLNDILETVPAKKALIFFDNFRRIIVHSNSRKGMLSALSNDLDNPFCIPKRRSSLEKAVLKFKNMINQYRYNQRH